MTVNVLILGKDGQLGKSLKTVFPQALFYSRNECDLTSPEDIQNLPWESIDILINAAAFTAVDKAETDEGALLAEKINFRGPQLLAELANQHNVVLVHISTDYVFDGTKNTPYTENDSYSPLSVYGGTKAQGEEAVSRTHKHYIIRTSWVIGEGHNFVRTMASLARQGIAPNVVNDQIGRLTFTEDLAQAIAHLLDNQAPYGTYNFTNTGEPVSWADIAKEVFTAVGSDADAVTGVSTAEYYAGKESIALRPLMSVLDTSKIEATGFTAPDWKTRLSEYLES
jgi:dTDP-4-dehydrorhamnose 3,5-epimerase